MRPTPLGLLVSLAVLAGSAGWAAARLVEAYDGRSLQVPVSVPVTTAILAIALLVWTLLARPRLQRRPGTKPMPPLLAARTAALSMAASRTGALILGLYAGIALGLLPAWSTRAGRESVINGVVCAAAALGLAAVALWLEHLCRVKDGDDDEHLPGRSSARRTGPEPAARGGERADQHGRGPRPTLSP